MHDYVSLQNAPLASITMITEYKYASRLKILDLIINHTIGSSTTSPCFL